MPEKVRKWRLFTCNRLILLGAFLKKGDFLAGRQS